MWPFSGAQSRRGSMTSASSAASSSSEVGDAFYTDSDSENMGMATGTASETDDTDTEGYCLVDLPGMIANAPTLKPPSSRSMLLSPGEQTHLRKELLRLEQRERELTRENLTLRTENEQLRLTMRDWVELHGPHMAEQEDGDVDVDDENADAAAEAEDEHDEDEDDIGSDDGFVRHFVCSSRQCRGEPLFTRNDALGRHRAKQSLCRVVRGESVNRDCLSESPARTRQWSSGLFAVKPVSCRTCLKSLGWEVVKTFHQRNAKFDGRFFFKLDEIVEVRRSRKTSRTLRFTNTLLQDESMKIVAADPLA
ncbi:MAG: hypothetical protein MHM6MM_003110 [Cercozoa sp. M6MM]